MNEVKKTVESPIEKKQALWAKMGDGKWFAIPHALQNSFLAAGAEVRQADELTREEGEPTTER